MFWDLRSILCCGAFSLNPLSFGYIQGYIQQPNRPLFGVSESGKGLPRGARSVVNVQCLRVTPCTLLPHGTSHRPAWTWPCRELHKGGQPGGGGGGGFCCGPRGGRKSRLSEGNVRLLGWGQGFGRSSWEALLLWWLKIDFGLVTVLQEAPWPETGR